MSACHRHQQAVFPPLFLPLCPDAARSIAKSCPNDFNSDAGKGTTAIHCTRQWFYELASASVAKGLWPRASFTRASRDTTQTMHHS